MRGRYSIIMLLKFFLWLYMIVVHMIIELCCFGHDRCLVGVQNGSLEEALASENMAIKVDILESHFAMRI